MHHFRRGVAALKAVWGVTTLEAEQVFVEQCVTRSELHVEAGLPFA